MSTRAPEGSDWMWQARPMAVRDSRRCWVRWLPTTVKRVVCLELMWVIPRGFSG